MQGPLGLTLSCVFACARACLHFGVAADRVPAIWLSSSGLQPVGRLLQTWISGMCYSFAAMHPIPCRSRVALPGMTLCAAHEPLLCWTLEPVLLCFLLVLVQG